MKRSLKFLALIAVCAMAFLAFKPNTKRIVIDAGHGGKDYGAVEGSHYEKEIVRRLAAEITNASSDINMEFFVIGEEDIFLNLEDRVKAINSLKPDLLLSLHLGSSPDVQKRGANAYVSAKNVDFVNSKKAAENVLRNLNHTNNVVVQQDLFVLKNVNCPALTLEVGYLSNVADRELLTTIEGQRTVAKSILKALTDF